MTDTDTLVFIYTTLPDGDAASTMARALVEARLAACCNIIAPMTSVYRWDGVIEASGETAMLIKTRRAMAQQVIEAARALHPYETPCFLTLPIDGVNAPYLAWALGETER